MAPYRNFLAGFRKSQTSWFYDGSTVYVTPERLLCRSPEAILRYYDRVIGHATPQRPSTTAKTGHDQE